jgi:cardiolipin synthase
VAAALTDAFDGYLARHLGAASHRGEVLDPIADKILLGGAFLAMVLNGSIEMWLAAIVIGRDVLILAFAGGALARTSSRRFPPSIWGKVSTVCQCLFILALAGNLASAVPTAVVVGFKWAVAVFTILSGVDYGRRATLQRA